VKRALLLFSERIKAAIAAVAVAAARNANATYGK